MRSVSFLSFPPDIGLIRSQEQLGPEPALRASAQWLDVAFAGDSTLEYDMQVRTTCSLHCHVLASDKGASQMFPLDERGSCSVLRARLREAEVALSRTGQRMLASALMEVRSCACSFGTGARHTFV